MYNLIQNNYYYLSPTFLVDEMMSHIVFLIYGNISPQFDINVTGEFKINSIHLELLILSWSFSQKQVWSG